MKKYIFLFIIMIISIMVVGCLGRDANKKENALKFKEEYEYYNDKKTESGKKYPKVEISKDNPIKYADTDEIIELVEGGSGVIYFGYPTCPWCRSAVPSLLSAAEEAGLDTIYYMNIKDERDLKELDKNGEIITKKEGSDNYKRLLKALDEYLDEYTLEDAKGNKKSTGEKRIYVPLVLFVKDGKVIGMHLDTVESQKDPYKGLNEKQTEELTVIYYKYMNKVLGDSCDENC